MPRRQRIETSGPLAGHTRQGRRLLSPLAATGVLNIQDWVRDDLPDLLWPVLTLAELGTAGGRNFVRWQEAVRRDLASRLEPQLLADGLDGRLTSLDRLVAEEPDAKTVIRQRGAEFGLLPRSVVEVLASYSQRPAAWLIDLKWTPLDQPGVELLARAITETLQDGHREAVIKCLSIWSAVQADTFRSDKTTIDLLKRYPDDPSTRSQADSVVRSSWGGLNGLKLITDESYFDESIKWCTAFWGANFAITRCLRRQDAESPPSQEEPNELAESGQTIGASARLQQFAIDLLSSYAESLEMSQAHPYDVGRQEVHAGMVFRAGRDVVAALGAPDLWCLEHGAHIGRTLIEARIYLEWMALQDPAIYSTYQEYGAGKAKLYARIAAEIPQDKLNPAAVEAIGELERLSRNNDVLDHRIVDTSDSFAGGKSLRAMADECGLLDVYRHGYYIASGVMHSEWWSVETNCMVQCLNILHRGHLIPSFSLNPGGNVEIADTWIDALYDLIQASLNILSADADAVKNAFSWLSPDGVV